MLYIVKTGKTLFVQEAHRSYHVNQSLERWFDARLAGELTTLKGRQTALKQRSLHRYNVPIVVNPKEVYFSTSAWRAHSTTFINACRIVSIEPVELHAHILFDQGFTIVLKEDSQRLKKRWRETLQFVKEVTPKH